MRPTPNVSLLDGGGMATTPYEEMPHISGNGMRTEQFPGITGPMTLQIRGSNRTPTRVRVIAERGRSAPEVAARPADFVALHRDASAVDTKLGRFRRALRGEPKPHGVSVQVPDRGEPLDPNTKPNEWVDIVARVPESSSVYVGVGYSHVQFEGRFGELSTRNIQGNVRVNGTYDRAELESNRGDLQLGDVAKESYIDARTTTGSVTANHVQGRGALGSDSGSVHVNRADPTGGRLDVYSQHGPVRWRAGSPEARENVYAAGDPAQIEELPMRPASSEVHQRGTSGRDGTGRGAGHDGRTARPKETKGIDKSR